MAPATRSTAPAQPPRPRITAQDPVFATVLVGPEHARYVVHEAFLSHYSGFFRAALSGDVREATDKVVKLEEDCVPSIFEVFVHWVYYQRFPDAMKGDDEQLVEDWGSTDGYATLTTNLIAMYVLGDRLLTSQLKRTCLDCLFRHVGLVDTETPDSDDVSYAFAHLPPNDPMCRLLVDLKLYHDWHVNEGNSGYEIGNEEDWPQAYLLSLARKATYIIGNVRHNSKEMYDFELDICDYHDHKTDEETLNCQDEQLRRMWQTNGA